MSKIFSFVAGLVIGAAAGTVATVLAYQKEKKKWTEKGESVKDIREKDDIVSCDIEEMREYYMDQLRNLGFDVREEVEEDYEEDYNSESNSEASGVNPLSDEEEEEDLDIEENGPIEPNQIPYEIPEHEFGSKDFYDFETMHYYQGDTVMTDSNYEFVDNWQLHIGGIEDRLNKETKDAIYIRNEVEQTDYEILIFADSYLHAVEGEELGDMADTEV